MSNTYNPALTSFYDIQKTIKSIQAITQAKMMQDIVNPSQLINLSYAKQIRDIRKSLLAYQAINVKQIQDLVNPAKITQLTFEKQMRDIRKSLLAYQAINVKQMQGFINPARIAQRNFEKQMQCIVNSSKTFQSTHDKAIQLAKKSANRNMLFAHRNAISQSFVDEVSTLFSTVEENLSSISNIDSATVEQDEVVSSSFHSIALFLDKLEHSIVLKRYPQLFGLLYPIILNLIFLIASILFSDISMNRLESKLQRPLNKLEAEQQAIRESLHRIQTIMETSSLNKLVTVRECYLYNSTRTLNKFCWIDEGFNFEIIEYKGKWVKVKLEDVDEKNQYKWLLKKYTKRLR